MTTAFDCFVYNLEMQTVMSEQARGPKAGAAQGSK